MRRAPTSGKLWMEILSGGVLFHSIHMANSRNHIWQGLHPFIKHQCFASDFTGMSTMVKQAPRVPVPFVFAVRSRAVAKVASIGLVARKRTQCWAGKFLTPGSGIER